MQQNQHDHDSHRRQKLQRVPLVIHGVAVRPKKVVSTRRLPKLCAQALPELLLICPPGRRPFGEHFVRAQQLGLVDNFFDLLEGTGYPPRGHTPVLDRWHDFSHQLREDLTRRAIAGDPAARTPLGYGLPPDDETPAWEPYCARQFIAAEMARLNPAGREACTQLLRELAARGAPPKVLVQAQELCVVTGFLVSACLEADHFWRMAHAQLLPLKQHYRAWKRQLRADRGFSDATKARVLEEIDVLLGLLEGYLPEKEALDAWRHWLHMDKKATVPQQKQRLWSLAFGELIGLIRPYCTGKYWIAFAEVTPEEAYAYASRLMHLWYPALWPDRPDLVKRRWHDFLALSSR